MKLLALCPCDRVILDKNDTPSLITIIQNLDVAFQSTAGAVPIPPNAVLPRDWWIYTRWFADDADFGKTIEHIVEIYWPSGDKFVEHRNTLKPIVLPDYVHQNVLQLFGFPAGQNGRLRIVVWLESQGRKITEIHECVININQVAPTSGNLAVPTQ